MSRRDLLQRSALGLGALGLAGLLADEARGGPTAGAGDDALAPRAPHFAGKAKRVIHFFLNGGPSHVDTFDPKPALTKYAGKPFPGGNLPTERKTGGCLPSPFGFKKCGQSGLDISDIFPHLQTVADELCVLRSMQ